MKSNSRIGGILVALILLIPPAQAFADTLSLSGWATGNPLSATNLNLRHTEIQAVINGNLANDNIKNSAGIVGSKLDLTSGTGRIVNSGGTVTTSNPAINSSQTWNSAGTVFTGWLLNVTATAAASASQMIDLQVGGTTVASIGRMGQFNLYPQDYASGPRTLMDGAWFNVASATYTDNVTAASGTAPRFIAYAFQRPALGAANTAVTTTHAATVFIASAPVTSTNMTLTNRYALWVDQGDVRLGGNLLFTDATYDIGATGATRPRNIYNSGILNVGTGGTPAGQAYIKSAAGGTIGLVVDMTTGPSVAAQEWRINGALAADIKLTGIVAYINLAERDLGADIAGAMLFLSRNSNATPGAGAIAFYSADGGYRYVWNDNSDLLRIGATQPNNTNQGGGTVVGDQASWGPEIPEIGYKGKEVLRQWDDPTKALEVVLATKIYDFKYKESSYLDADNQPAVFTGIVGFDRRDPFLKNVGRQQIPALNEVNAFGYLFLSIRGLQQQIDELRARLNQYDNKRP